MWDNWLIKNIMHRDTKQTRTDGRYPHRIGRLVSFERKYMKVGIPAVLTYEDEDMRGYALATSPTQSIVYKYCDGRECCEIITENSIYILEKQEQA